MFEDPFAQHLDISDPWNEEQNWYTLPLHQSNEDTAHVTKTSDFNNCFSVSVSECEIESICNSLDESQPHDLHLACNFWQPPSQEKALSTFPDPVFCLFPEQSKQHDISFTDAWNTVGCGSSSDSETDSTDSKMEYYGRPQAASCGKPAGKKQVQSQWTAEEHERFLEALDKYGTQQVARQSNESGRVFVGLGNGVAKQIAAHVKTRSVLQVRSHAQKFFLKQNRMTTKI
eukprot:310402-Hanusia_phi.AAC.2